MTDIRLTEAATVERVMQHYGIVEDRRWFTQQCRDVLTWGASITSFEQAAHAVAEEWIEVDSWGNWRLFWEQVKGWFHR